MPASALGGGQDAAAARLPHQVAAAGPPAVLAGRDVLLRAGREAAVDDEGVAAVRTHDAGVVEHAVEAAELGYGGVGDTGDVGLAGDVAVHVARVVAELVREPLPAVVLDVGQHDEGPFGGHERRRGLAETAGRTC